MKSDTLDVLRPAAAILICAALMLTLSLGLRQSLGIFMQPMTKDIAITVSEFTFAIAIQNIAWGIAQPFTGALAVRVGFRRDHDHRAALVHARADLPRHCERHASA